MKLFYSAKTDVGNVRTNNEDYFFAGKLDDKQESYLFIVADGMGGHSSGEVASYKAVTNFVEGVKKSIGNASDVPAELKRIILHVNDLLILEAAKMKDRNPSIQKGMGTTLSALYLRDNLAYIAHVGDSRIYRYVDPELSQLTEDHSLVGRLLRDGSITKAEAANHPKRNVLYQSIGLKRDIEVQTIGPVPVRKGHRFLLCSDGLYNEISGIEIEGFFKLNSTEAIADGLIKKCRRRTAADNITVIVVSTEKDEAIPLKDTVEISNPIIGSSKKKLYITLLLVLLFLLLAALGYIVIKQLTREENPVPAANENVFFYTAPAGTATVSI